MKRGLDQHVLRSVHDWRFFFDRAESAMGIRAVDYGSWAMSGGSSPPLGPSEENLAASRRHARIEARLREMPAAAVMMIRRTCEEDARPLWQAFGKDGLGNIADLTDAAARAHRASQSTRELSAWLDRLGAKLAHGRATTEDRITRERISGDVEELIRIVHEDYEDARRRTG